jgi:integrase
MPKTAAKQEPRSRGQIIQRGPETWLLRVALGKDHEGKRKYANKTIKGSRKEAEVELTKLLREQDTGSYIEPSKLTLREWLEKWLATKVDISPKTRRGYEERMELDVYPFLGGKRLDQLTTDDIQATYGKLMKDRGLSPTTVQYTHRVLKQALELAWGRGILQRNPARWVNLPAKRGKTQKIMPLSPEQARTFLGKNADTPLYPLWVLMLSTGMRPQEALALQWADIDGGYIRIQRTLEEVEKGKFQPVEAAKTEGSLRSVSVPKDTLEALQKHRAQQAAAKLELGIRHEWIFANRAGNPMDPTKARKGFKAALRRAGLPTTHRLYDLRHTHATSLLMAGVNPKVVAERLGHSSIQLTLNTYSRVLPELEKTTADTVGKLLFG